MEQKSAFAHFISNPVIYTTFLGWFVAQTIKVVTGIFREKRFNFKWFVGTGGMPSSHAAGATALAASVALYEGMHTALFGVTLMFTVVVICDAQGVRRATGKQAEILNTIMEDIYFRKKLREEKLKELVGHTPVQVFAGIFLGLLTAYTIARFNGV